MSIVPIKNWRDYPPGREKYQLYLASREWAVLKEAVKARSGGICERCRSSPGQSVHHQTYERVYEEQLEDLVHTCDPCHEFLSGKRDDDPAAARPPQLLGRKIRSVYLAGKITGSNWRDEILHGGWSEGTPGSCGIYWGPENPDGWPVIPECAPVPGCKPLDFAGPFWRPCSLVTGGVSGASSEGRHRYAQTAPNGEGGVSYDPGMARVAQNAKLAIIVADLVFAWIDSRDCYGTLIEIGYAAANFKTVVVGFPRAFDTEDFWLATMFADLAGYHDSAKVFWDEVWTLYTRPWSEYADEKLWE